MVKYGLFSILWYLANNSPFPPSPSTRSDLEQNLSLLLFLSVNGILYFFFFFIFLFSCVVRGGFLSPHSLFCRLIGFIHMSLCCDSVSFDFIKPATTVARFIPHSCLFIFRSVPYQKAS